MRVLAMTTPKVWAARRSAHVGLALLVLATLVAATTATSADGTGSKAPVAAPERPNIVFILVDDMRADELRFLPKTRRLLGRRGVTYTQALSPHPLCCPARAELITGQYAQNNGVKENFGPWGGFQALKAPDNHIGAWMRDRGYRTGFIGRFLNGYLGVRRIGGWSEWQPLVRRIYDYWRPGFFREDRLDKGYVTHAIRRRAARVIRGSDGDPFFLYIWPRRRTRYRSLPPGGRASHRPAPNTGTGTTTTGTGPPRSTRPPSTRKTYPTCRPTCGAGPALARAGSPPSPVPVPARFAPSTTRSRTWCPNWPARRAGQDLHRVQLRQRLPVR